MLSSTMYAACVSLHWASIVRAFVLFVLGAAVQSQWTAWRSRSAEQVDETAKERERTPCRQYPAQARQRQQQPSSAPADKIWTSYADCLYPRLREKPQRPNKKIEKENLEDQKRWASYAESHYMAPLQTICQDGIYSRVLQRQSSVFSEGLDAAVTQGTSNFVRSLRKPVQPAATNVGSAGLQQSGSATSLQSLCSPVRERRNRDVKPSRQDLTLTVTVGDGNCRQATVTPTNDSRVGMEMWQRNVCSTYVYSKLSSQSPDRERALASGKPRRKETKTVAKSSGTRFYADVVAKSRAEPQRISRSVSF